MPATFAGLYAIFSEALPPDDEVLADVAAYDLMITAAVEAAKPELSEPDKTRRSDLSELHQKNLDLAKQIEAGVLAWAVLNGHFAAPQSCLDADGGLSPQGREELRALQRQGEDAKSKMVLLNYPRAMRIAKGFCEHTGMEPEAAESAAALGLVEAIRRHDYRKPPRRGTTPEPFEAAARITVLSNLQRSFCEEGFAVTLPHNVGEVAVRWLDQARSDSFRLEELIAESGWAPRPLDDILQWVQSWLPLDVADNAGPESPDPLDQVICDEQLRLLFDIINRLLSFPDRQMLDMRFPRDGRRRLTYDEIAEHMGKRRVVVESRLPKVCKSIAPIFMQDYGSPPHELRD